MRTFLPTFIHQVKDRHVYTPCTVDQGAELTWLLHTWHIKEFHFAIMRESKSASVDVPHEYTCSRIPFIQSLMISYPFSLVEGKKYFVMDRAICQMSKQCFVSTRFPLISFEIPLWGSKANVAIDTPRVFKLAKHLFSNSVCWLHVHFHQPLKRTER